MLGCWLPQTQVLVLQNKPVGHISECVHDSLEKVTDECCPLLLLNDEAVPNAMEMLSITTRYFIVQSRGLSNSNSLEWRLCGSTPLLFYPSRMLGRLFLQLMTLKAACKRGGVQGYTLKRVYTGDVHCSLFLWSFQQSKSLGYQKLIASSFFHFHNFSVRVYP